MGRPPIPTHLKLLRGNPGLRKLDPNSEPQPEPHETVPDPPQYLRGYAIDEWCLVAGELHRMGLLTKVDVASLASYCIAYSQWRTSLEALDRMANNDPLMQGLIIKSRSGEAVANPLVGIARKSAHEMLRFATEFGFTPSARTRINSGLAGIAEPPSKFKGLLVG